MGAEIDADIQAKSESWNMRVIGHHDLNGHGDGMQLLKQGRYVYLAHLGTSPMALSIHRRRRSDAIRAWSRKCPTRRIPTRIKFRSPAIF